jgi:hypothetical protein
MKVKLGPIIGQASGSIGAQTFAHNRFGMYTRNRTIPTQPNSAKQLIRRSAFATLSAAWAIRTTAERLAWKIWAQNNPVVDRLGDKRILTGHQAYVALNSRLIQIGEPSATTPPILPMPTGLTSVSVVVSIATNNAAVTFLPDPLGANNGIYVQACKCPTATINYTKNLMRFAACGGKAQASPYSVANLDGILGALTLNETCVFWIHVFDEVNGQLSPPREVRALVGA